MTTQNEQVIYVIDGDTFRTANRSNSVRLADVYAPEKGEFGAVEATKALIRLIGGKTVSIKTVGRSHGRAVAELWIGSLSVNAAMREEIRKINL